MTSRWPWTAGESCSRPPSWPGAASRSRWRPWSGGRAPRRASRARGRSSPPAGGLHGWIGGACAEPTVIREAREVIRPGPARLLLLGNPEQFGGAVPDGMTFVPISCQSEGALEVYIEPVLPVPHLVVVGTSPMARTLAELARALGWQADLIAGQDFTAAERGPRAWSSSPPRATTTRACWSGRRRPARVPRPGGLAQAGRGGARLPGRPRRAGGQLDRVRVPAGLDLGSTPTARSPSRSWPSWCSCARPARCRSQRRSPARGRRRAPAGSEPGREATDPVCGMTVPIRPGRLPPEHERRPITSAAPAVARRSRKTAAYLKRDTRC